MVHDYYRKLKYSIFIISFIWCIIVTFSAFWNLSMYDKTVYENARADAESSYNKDLVYRRWVSLMGGVYVTPSETTPPNPYLKQVPERDVTTINGKDLTLVNPAYMTRQVHELSLNQYGTKGHITSLNPLNPINKADKWESEALKSFEKGASEIYSIESINDSLYLRYMKPMITEKGCLKCHEKQGYKVGDIRGGVSVMVPMEKYIQTAKEGKNNMLLFHVSIFFAGMIAFLLFGFTIKRNIFEREKKTLELRQSEEKLLSQKNILDSIFENSPYIMLLVDENATVLNINRPGTLFSGKGKEELKGDLAGIALNCMNSFQKPGCGGHPSCFTCPIRSAVNEVLQSGEPIQNREASMTLMVNLKKVNFDLLISASLLKHDGIKEVLITIADITAQKRSEQIINESKNRFESVFELSPYAIVITDIQENFYVDINKAFENLSGYSKNEIIGKSVDDLKFWSDIEERKKWKEMIKENSAARNLESKFINRNGEEYLVQVCTKNIELSGRGVTISIIQDVTEKRISEELVIRTAEELNLAQKISHVGSWHWNRKDNSIHWSDEMYNLWGIDKKNINGDLNTVIRKNIHPEDLHKFNGASDSFLLKDISSPLEFRLVMQDGEIRTVRGETGRIEKDDQGNTTFLMGIVQDITERIEAASAQMKYEQRMSFFIRNNPLAVIEWDVDFRVKEWNLAAEQIFGYTKEEALGRCGDFIINGPVIEKIFDLWNEIIHNFGGKKSTNENITKEGKVILCEWYNTALKDADGVVSGVISVAHDITDEVINREELRRSKNMTQNILNSVPQAIFWKDKDGKYLGCNKNFATIAGILEEADILGKTDYELPWPREEAEAYRMDDFEVINSRLPKYNIIEPLLTHNGERIWIETTKIPLFDEEGNANGVLGVFADITEKREAEVQQKLLVDTLNASFNELYIFDAENMKFEFVSNGALKNLGFTMEQMRFMTPLDLKPELSEEMFAGLLAPLYTKELSVVHFETVNKRANGTLYPVEAHVQLFDHNNRKVFLAVIVDITEQKAAAEKLIKSEERFSKIFRVNPAAIVISRLSDFQIIDVNESYIKLFGYSRSELIGHDAFELGIYVDINDYFEMAKHFIEKEKIPTLELKLRDKRKRILHILVSTEIVEINRESCLISIMQDITARITAEEKIKYSEEKYRTLFETMAQGVVYQDHTGAIISANKAAEKILGMSIDKMKGVTSFDPGWKAIKEDGTDFPGDEHPAMVSLKKGISVSNVTMGIYNKHEHNVRWLVINSTPQFRPGEEKPYQVYATFTDITERKIAEDSLKESELRFASIFHISPVSMVITRMKDGVFLEVNKTWQNTTGYSRNEAINKTAAQLDLWMVGTKREPYINNIVEHGAIHDYEFKLKRKDGRVLDMLVSAEMIELKGEMCILNVVQDITSRKEIEQALRESEERYKSLFDLSPDAILVHKQNEIIMANKAAYILLKANSASEINGHDVFEFVHPDFKEAVSKQMGLMSQDGKFTSSVYEVFLCCDGSQVDVEVSTASCLLEGEITFQMFARNITERLKTELVLKAQREKIIAILKAIPDMMYILSAEGVFLDYHSASEKDLFADADNFLDKNIKNVFDSNIADLTLEKIQAVKTFGEMQTFEYELDFNGLKNFESRLVACGKDSYLAIVRDITANKRNEIELKKSLEEKDTLLRELYHRTKNNMQVISAMLQLQTFTMTDPELVRVLFETSNRIKTMALVHQKLYQSKDLSQINLKDYINELIALLKELFNVDGEKIKISLNLEDQLILIDYAVPCGLIVNEIVSNTFKYAFPGEKRGNLEIDLVRKNNGSLVLTFKDDGIGLPQNFDIDSGSTLGMQLIKTLVVHQLDGNIEIDGTNGVKIEISFCDNQYGIRI